jgi:hypothetical protein
VAYYISIFEVLALEIYLKQSNRLNREEQAKSVNENGLTWDYL